MSLQKKIILSFLISAFIIAVLAAFEYINFIQIKKEIVFLETTDTIRSKSLQLRRHEKNFFLTGDLNEVKNVRDYLKQLDDILAGNRYQDSTGGLFSLREKIDEYSRRFNHIDKIVYDFRNKFDRIKPFHMQYSVFFRIIETTFLERPLVNAELIENIFHLKKDNPAIRNLYELDSEIRTLRKDGEEILVMSKELDKTAREKVDGFIRRSQIAILIFFTVFLIAGGGAFLYVTGNVVKRLNLLTAVVERTGGGDFSKMAVGRLRWGDNDEVGVLIQKFNSMEEQLIQREKELLQSKKLAAIGTLASGVAHELNNPLNNIYTTAQRLLKKSEGECPVFIKKGLDDIFGQTMRVKSIVGDLLEFARGRELNLRPVELRSLVNGVYKHIGLSRSIDSIRFYLEFHPEEIVIYADQEQMERVFINLISNAIDAVSGEGDIIVRAVEEDTNVRIRLSDTGHGISQEAVEKIFEPFYTTKDKGTGLGLAIVFNIIQKHNGEITVESEEGRGTIFIITLPKSAGKV
ncbi:MAG: ATP-binding protein [Thermodesulfovibrionales bacterium]|nr:ATP-binding protein [Thermodesulfovibrionales bacterium]